jgi:hypothetical protein
LVFRVDGKSVTCLFATPDANATCDTVTYGAEWFSGLEPSKLGDTFDEILGRNSQGSRWLRPEVFSVMPSHIVWRREDGGAEAEYISQKYLIVRASHRPIAKDPEPTSTVPTTVPAVDGGRRDPEATFTGDWRGVWESDGLVGHVTLVVVGYTPDKKKLAAEISFTNAKTFPEPIFCDISFGFVGRRKGLPYLNMALAGKGAIVYGDLALTEPDVLEGTLNLIVVGSGNASNGGVSMRLRRAR